MIIKTNKPINIVGVTDIPTGAVVNFYANFAPNGAITCHSEWYANEDMEKLQTPIFAPIQGLSHKDNITINLAEFTPAQIEAIDIVRTIMQEKVAIALNERMNDKLLILE